MKMIKRAVEQRPDDGYIVDSLGWLYRIGNYEDAVKHLERAIISSLRIRPSMTISATPIGASAASWKARFQWAHARDLKPEPEELPKIEAKLENGLPEDTSSAASATRKRRRQGRVIEGWSPCRG